jgi:hypothetical protein
MMTATIELTGKEIADLERLSTPNVYAVIQLNLSKGFDEHQVTQGLVERARCSLRVAKAVVWEARAQEEWSHGCDMGSV